MDKNLNKAKAIIKKYDISFENWFKDLARIFKTNKIYNPSKVIDTLLKMFSYREVKEKIEINCIKDGFGYAVETSPNNIKIVIKEIESLNGLRTLLHELGHAIFYSLNEEQGLFRVLPASLDESLAVVFETIAANLFLTGEEKEKVSELITLEYTRCAISALFEFDLWQKPNQAEQLYKKHYNKLGLKICDTGIWAYDSFRSIDSVYIHNYVIGASIANKLMRYLKQLHSNNYVAWGSWLYNNLYHDGRRRKLSEKISVIEN